MSSLGEFGRYQQGASPLHRADARTKILVTLAFMATIFLVTSPLQALWALAGFLGLCALGRISPLSLLASSAPLLALLLVFSLLNLFVNPEGPVLWSWGALSIHEGGLFSAAQTALRLGLLVLNGALLLAVTEPLQLTRGLSSLLSPLGRLGVPVEQLAFVLALALRFVPTLTSEIQGVMDAQRARGAAFDSGGPLKRLRALLSILVPTFAGALRHAQGLSLALEARHYDPNRPRTIWKQPHLGQVDAGLCIYGLIYVIGLSLL